MPETTPSFLTKLRLQVIGSDDDFSLESRIFHSFSALVFVVLPLQIAFNLAIGLYAPAIITTVVLAIQIFLYSLSRFKHQLNLAVILSAIEVNIFTAANYFFNAGIAGSTLLLFSISLFMIISVSQKKHWLIWFTINLAIVIGITCIEYYYPSSIKISYASRKELFIDNVGTYIIIIVILYIGTSSIRRNYSAQKQLADEKTNALEMLNAEKDKLFSIISHDLRSPLALTQQYFSALKEVEMDNEERLALEKDLVSNLANAEYLVNNLLNWAKNQMKGVAPNLKNINLNQVFARKAEVFTPIALNKDIQLTTIINESIVVKADIDMLQLIIRNLLNNAIKFTPSGGKIELKAIKQNNECIISVSDNGIGIPLEKQGDIFSLKANSTYGTENEKGTGLGLVLCRDYTLLQGGKIWFTSAENAGTTFFVSLPAV
ncbi:MAG: HAMP domain-containing sensor histidine kinase [Mucilaginibacter sp.]